MGFVVKPKGLTVSKKMVQSSYAYHEACVGKLGGLG